MIHDKTEAKHLCIRDYVNALFDYGVCTSDALQQSAERQFWEV